MSITRAKRLASSLRATLSVPNKRGRRAIDLVALISRLNQEKNYNLELKDEVFPRELGKISAILLKEKNKALIVVNRKHHEHRQRFSIAHEIGHLLMHDNAEHVKVEKELEPRLFTRAEGVQSMEEKEANVFAAELLMPEDLLVEDLLKSIDNNEDNVLSKLAADYEVSEIALSYRLRNLKI